MRRCRKRKGWVVGVNIDGCHGQDAGAGVEARVGNGGEDDVAECAEGVEWWKDEFGSVEEEGDLFAGEVDWDVFKHEEGHC